MRTKTYSYFISVMNTTSHTTVGWATERLCVFTAWREEEEGRAGQSEIFLIIILMPASPPPRVGPPNGRGSTPSHSVGVAHCVWRTHTGATDDHREVGNDKVGKTMGNEREGGFRDRESPDRSERRQNKGNETQRTNTSTKEERNRWEWAGRHKMIIGQNRTKQIEITGLTWKVMRK